MAAKSSTRRKAATPAWVVLKFGGTSVSSVERWETIATLLRQRLAEAKFRSARVFLQVELSDQMKQYLGASTARAEVPSVILE